MAKEKVKATYTFDGWVNEDTEDRKYVRNQVGEIYVGMPCSHSGYSDIYPAHVSRISDSGKTVWIKNALYKPAEDYHYLENQNNIITPNPNAPEHAVRKNKDGNWKMNKYTYVTFGFARHYHDPHF